MNEKHTSRDYALDLVRVFAFFCVVSIHFFLHTDFYSVVLRGSRMFASSLLRSFFTICVPLFLVLSGYLAKKVPPTRQYYKKLFPILLEYLAASICCILYRALSQGCPDGVDVFLVQEILGLFTYTTAPYGWYVEMYIGLFLLIPFLNILYFGMTEQSQKQALLLTLLVLTAIPCLVNHSSLVFDGSEYQFQLLPQWWSGIYPITYYYIGAYLREYPLQLKKKSLFLLILSVTILSGSLYFTEWFDSPANWSSWQSYESLITVLLTVLVFSFLSQIRINPNSLPARILPRLSGLCFCAYLVSYIFDDLIYKQSGLFSDPSVYRIELYIFTVPAVFLCSLLLSAAIRVCLRLPSCIRKHLKRQDPLSNVP